MSDVAGRLRESGDKGDPWALAVLYRAALEKIIRESPDSDAWSRAQARTALGGSDDPYVRGND
jgi:hypothetical protein